jgi:hypothetical protein
MTLAGRFMGLVVAGWTIAACTAGALPPPAAGSGVTAGSPGGGPVEASPQPASPAAPVGSLVQASSPGPASMLATASPVPPAASPTATTAVTVQPSFPTPNIPPATPQKTPDTTLTPTPGASGSSGSAIGTASGCSGTAENRDFFAAVAAAVSWPVYCAVLPNGWFVEDGAWRLHGGGQLQVSYRGPNGARLALQEGVWCTSGASACEPKDRDLGEAAFGDMTGELVTLGPNEPGDGYAVYVAPGQAPSWTATATNVDQGAFQAFCAALLRLVP